MSDIIIATGAIGIHGQMVFAMNADRPVNEPQSVVRLLGEGASMQVQCRHIAVERNALPQELLLSRASGDWGGHMGMNEHGVCIGYTPNDARVEFFRTDKGLTGPDLLRLALEQARTAREAMECIASLLSEYGQDANSGFKGQQQYAHSSFGIADGREAIALETAGKEWAAKVVTEGVLVLNECLGIGEDFDLHSPGLVAYAQQQKWVSRDKPFSFREAYGSRQQKGMFQKEHPLDRSLIVKIVEGQAGQFGLQEAMRLLGGHHPAKDFKPSKSDERDLCRHAHQGHEWQTAASMVAELGGKGRQVCWMTGTSNPCLSVFKPFFLPGRNMLEGLQKEASTLVDDSLWWKAERFHRYAATNYKGVRKAVEQERQELQQRVLDTFQEFLFEQASEQRLDQLSNDAVRLHLKKLLEWNFYLKKNGVKGWQFAPGLSGYLDKITKEVTPII